MWISVLALISMMSIYLTKNTKGFPISRAILLELRRVCRKVGWIPRVLFWTTQFPTLRVLGNILRWGCLGTGCSVSSCAVMYLSDSTIMVSNYSMHCSTKNVWCASIESHTVAPPTSVLSTLRWCLHNPPYGETLTSSHISGWYFHLAFSRQIWTFAGMHWMWDHIF